MDMQTRGRGDQYVSATEGRVHASGLEYLVDHGDLMTMLEYERTRTLRKVALPDAPSLQVRSVVTPVWRKEGMALLKLMQYVLLMSFLNLQLVSAAFINFENCLSPNIVNSNPPLLQFRPLFVYATFNSTAASHNINVTVYGNVSGKATQEQYPLPDDPQWANPNETLGKIPFADKANNKQSTFDAIFNVLDYTPYDAPAAGFCDTLVHGHCPLGPVFHANA